MKKIFAIALLSIVLIPASAGAATGLDRIVGIANTIMNWMYTFAMILGVLAILWAALRYITAGGDPKQVDEAKKMIIYVSIGLAIAILAKGVPSIVSSIIQ